MKALNILNWTPLGIILFPFYFVWKWVEEPNSNKRTLIHSLVMAVEWSAIILTIRYFIQ